MSATAVSTVSWGAGWEPALEARRRVERPAASTPALRLTRRGRAVVSLVALAVALGAALSAQSAAAEAPGGSVAVVTHTVAVGETLWEIAGTVTVAGQDRRDVVDRLVELNGLSSGGLQVGQQILVPAE